MNIQRLASGTGGAMNIQRLASGIWTAFCWTCHYGVFRRDRAAMFDWAVGHAERHQRGERQ